jgi:hypothetical protein
MISLWVSQGAAVQGGAVGPMILGSTAVSGFAFAYAELFPYLQGHSTLPAPCYLRIRGQFSYLVFEVMYFELQCRLAAPPLSP